MKVVHFKIGTETLAPSERKVYYLVEIVKFVFNWDFNNLFPEQCFLQWMVYRKNDKLYASLKILKKSVRYADW